MSRLLVSQYHTEVERIIQYGGSRKETSIRVAFQNLVNEYCKPREFRLIPELAKYELNLKREFPRLPFYEDFQQWVSWGKQLMGLHINYETVEPYPLKRIDLPLATNRTPKAKLKADAANGTIILDDVTTLEGVPKIAWEYRLGNRCALEWILDQYKEKKPKDPTIAEKFNTYRFADYKEQVIDLLQRVCIVSVETMQILRQIQAAQN